VALAPKPEPKEICPSCHRPVAVLKNGTCLYCGERIPGLHVVEAPRGMPAEAAILLEPRQPGISSFRRWTIRIIALIVGSGIAAFVAGSCMKMKGGS